MTTSRRWSARAPSPSCPGIGSTTLAVLSDLVETGDSGYLDELRETTPEGLVEMLRIPGLGPTRIHRIHTGLGVETVADLEAAAKDGRLAACPGSATRLRQRSFAESPYCARHPASLIHSLAAAEAQRLRRAVAKLPGVTRVEIAGSVRRSNEVARDIDLVAACEDGSNVKAAAAQDPGGPGDRLEAVDPR